MLRSRRILALTTAILALGLLGPVMADAGRGKAGKWKGKAAGSQMSFKLGTDGKRIKDFFVPNLTVYCYGEGLTTKVFLISSTKVKKSGKFSKTYTTKDSGGEKDGKLTVSGRFKSKRKVSGKLTYNRSGCSSGPVKFKAKRKG
jgi:hypothetical protein